MISTHNEDGSFPSADYFNVIADSFFEADPDMTPEELQDRVEQATFAPAIYEFRKAQRQAEDAGR
jgi:hypothetical protein